MTIKPTQLAVKFLFEQNHTFQVPKYQRDYAWDDEAINDFVEDIERCLLTRTSGEKRNHFFGGIVAFRSDVPASNRSNYEVIDGQQRLASFVMLAAIIIRTMRDVLGDLVKKGNLTEGEKKAKEFLEQTIEPLRGLYLAYKDLKDLEYVEVPKFTLSQADDNFFQNIIEGGNPESKRASHERIQAAWIRLGGFLEQKMLEDDDVEKKALLLQILVSRVLAEDFTVIFMCSDTRSEAYQIFQVLNDRGIHLTDGDLLRAHTMELLDQKPLLAIQTEVANHWDNILAYPAADIDSYLRWYFSSLEGKRPKSSNLADQFLEFRFGIKDQEKIEKKDAEKILEEVKRIDVGFAQLEILGSGEWPYSNHTDVNSWDRERLRMLVIHLKHTNAMPLLLALCLLDSKKFAEAVSSIERFVFRYKTVGSAHISPMTELYHRHAKKIREGMARYRVKTLRTELRTLSENVVSDQVFEAKLRETRYSPRGGNGYIRYMLITLEDYHEWYEQGSQGVPKCKDKTRVFDFSNTTLEHIYPQAAEANSKDILLEEVKHTLGNLTIFGPDDNGKIGNKPYSDKKPVLEKSSLQLNRDVGKNDNWTADLVNKRTEELVKMALKIFVP